VDLNRYSIDLLRQLATAPERCLCVGALLTEITEEQAQSLVDQGIAQWRNADHSVVQLSEIGRAYYQGSEGTRKTRSTVCKV